MPILYPHPLWSRLISLTLAAAYASLLLLYPKVVGGAGEEVAIGTLALLLWGVAAGFTHGLDFVPRRAFWRLVFHPAVAWVVMGGVSLALAF